VKEDDSNPITGLAWYRREQWPLLREEAADSEVLEETYEDWLSIAQKAVLDLAREGVRAERVEIDVEELLAWCRANNRPLNGKARAEFTTRQLRQKHEEEGGRTA
jgi:hypothetical protein